MLLSSWALQNAGGLALECTTGETRRGICSRAFSPDSICHSACVQPKGVDYLIPSDSNRFHLIPSATLRVFNPKVWSIWFHLIPWNSIWFHLIPSAALRLFNPKVWSIRFHLIPSDSICRSAFVQPKGVEYLIPSDSNWFHLPLCVCSTQRCGLFEHNIETMDGGNYGSSD